MTETMKAIGDITIIAGTAAGAFQGQHRSASLVIE